MYGHLSSFLGYGRELIICFPLMGSELLQVLSEKLCISTGFITGTFSVPLLCFRKFRSPGKVQTTSDLQTSCSCQPCKTCTEVSFPLPTPPNSSLPPAPLLLVQQLGSLCGLLAGCGLFSLQLLCLQCTVSRTSQHL